ncbi:hypothetical protein LTR95_000621 [Oleoguttula sp. CCFEE 5521]
MSRPNLRLRFDLFRNDPSAQLLHESQTPTTVVDYYRTWKQWANDTVRDGVIGFVQPSPKLLQRRDSDMSENESEFASGEEQEEGVAAPTETGLGIRENKETGVEETGTASPVGGDNAGGDDTGGGTAGGDVPPDGEGDTTGQRRGRRVRPSYFLTAAIVLVVAYMMRKIQQHGERVFAPGQTPWIPTRDIPLLLPHCAVAWDITELMVTFANDTQRSISLIKLPSLGPPSTRYRGWFGPAVYSDIVKRDCAVMQYPPVDLARQYAVRLEQVTNAIGQALKEESAIRARKLDWIKRLVGGIDARMANSNSNGSPLKAKDDPFKAQNAIFGLLQEYLVEELSVVGSGRNVSDELWGVLNDAISLRKTALTIASRAEKSNTLESYYKFEINRRNGLLSGMFYAFLQHFSNDASAETRCADYDIRQLRQVVAASLFVEGMINSTLETRYEVGQLLQSIHTILRESMEAFTEDRDRPVTTPQAYMDEHRAQLTSEIHQVFNYVDHVVSVKPKLVLQQQAQKWTKTAFADCVVEDNYVFENEIPITRPREPVTFWEKWQEDKGEYGAVVRHAHEKIFISNTEQDL